MKKYKLLDKKSVIIDKSVHIGKGAIIYGGNVIKGDTIIGENVILYSNNYINNSFIDSGTSIECSNIVGGEIGRDCKIGPYSRIREKTALGEGCKIGNFVEIKNSILGKGVKASHLAYIGDADIGDNCNIGCGAIFVNYNGKTKNRSVVGNNCFIGSNVNVVAPVNIADNSYICAGTTITIDTSPYDFVIGRSRETVKSNYYNKYIDK